ncbi:hypothetical protein M3P05_20160 [Sansalvadorimonas sp. 2012CJ34-2]|uniref:Uncharacterized protein n=1 Tax=Parendozoicomonas callyspongiae TaxID=2942213 RepID=A0ABT0PLH9_9GAMM|nr:hypothetical protein [Sansalvadorimonas sp. 2012CJ34-2]MCL6272239.1 hypothetical protein [Sansalvadorimonas sp. 2012CJ34-2]
MPASAFSNIAAKAGNKCIKGTPPAAAPLMQALNAKHTSRVQMELITLKRFRKIVPGVTFILFAIPLYIYITGNFLELDETLKMITGTGATVIAYIIGSVFSSLKFRGLINNEGHTRITNNIRSRLVDEGLTTQEEEETIKKLKSSKKLMNIFYNFIDNDPSLKEKSKLVRDNGLMWTSTADVALIGYLFSAIYFSLYFFLEYAPILYISGTIIIIITLLSHMLIHPRTVKEHIRLGNDQIDFITTNHKKELQKRIAELVNDFK